MMSGPNNKKIPTRSRSCIDVTWVMGNERNNEASSGTRLHKVNLSELGFRNFLAATAKLHHKFWLLPAAVKLHHEFWLLPADANAGGPHTHKLCEHELWAMFWSSDINLLNKHTWDNFNVRCLKHVLTLATRWEAAPQVLALATPCKQRIPPQKQCENEKWALVWNLDINYESTNKLEIIWDVWMKGCLNHT